jgi:hypothetical protein
MKVRDTQGAGQECAHVAGGDQRRQQLQRLLGVQPRAVARNQFERGPQEVIRRPDQRAQVDP